MAYDEFRAEYDAVLRACKAASLDRHALAGEIVRLTARRDTLTTPGDRDRATADVTWLEDLLAAAGAPSGRAAGLTRGPVAGARSGPAAGDAHLRAAAVAGRSHDASGSPAERIERARRGIVEIRAVADGIREWDERIAVLRLTEPLAMLVAALEAGHAEGGR